MNRFIRRCSGDNTFINPISGFGALPERESLKLVPEQYVNAYC